MKIIFLTGQSGTGKTSIGQELAKNSDKYNFIHSYTDRPMRSSDEWGHTFVNSNYMDMLLERSDIVAQTQIKQKRYCTIKSQFDENKINIYTVDLNGINDTLDVFSDAEIMVILIRRDSIDIDEFRFGRDILIPAREDADFLIDNDTTIQSAANTINALANMDLFDKPSHRLTTIEDKLDSVFEQERLLHEIEHSLEEQRWYRDKPTFDLLFDYVNEQINDENVIELSTNNQPLWDAEDCIYTLFAWYEDSDDDSPFDGFRLQEQISKYVYDFCSEHDCLDISYRISIDCEWIGLKDEQR